MSRRPQSSGMESRMAPKYPFMRPVSYPRSANRSGPRRIAPPAYNRRALRLLCRAPCSTIVGGMQDPIYKLLFSLPRMAADLLRGFVPDGWACPLDLTTRKKLSAEYIGDDLHRRFGDMLWRIRFRDPVPRDHARELLVMLEFQSSVERGMPARVLSYTNLVHQELIRRGALHEGGVLPPVLPIVIYNGERRWTAAVEMAEITAPVDGWLARCQPSQWYVLVDVGAFGAQDLPAENWVSALVELENSASYPDLLRVLREVFARYREPEAQEFKEALYKWAQHSPLTLQGELLPSYRELEGGEMATLQEARAREWQARWFQRGHEQGIEQGQVEGRRALLRRQTARKFDAETAGRLSGVLNGLADPERLAEIGEWIIECETSAELLDRAKQMSRRG